MKYDPLIFGKNDKEHIVCIEVDESEAEIFIEENGVVRSEFIPNKYWILSSKPLKNKWARMKGDLHYKWGQQYNTRHEFFMSKRFYQHEDVLMINDPKEALMVKDGLTQYKGMDFKDVSILSFDIESTGLEHNNNSKVLIISNTFRSQGKIERKLFCFDEFKTDAEMFDTWCEWVREKNPSIMVGHNVFCYDFPYLAFCADRAGTSLKLGRDDSEIKFNNYESKFRKDGSQFLHYKKVKVYGRELVDTMFLSMKYDVQRKYESYGLKPIIKYEGLEVKNRQFYDASQIRFNYKNPIEWEKIKRYAEFDADDALALYDLMAASYFYMAQSIPKSYQLIHESATGSQINSMMMRAYLQNAHSLPRAEEASEFVGALSGGNPGVYKNCWKVDIASLYPSLIREYEIGLGKKDPANYFLQLAEYFTIERLRNKKLAKETGLKYYDDLQSSAKILINSMYGFMGAPGLTFNNPAGAAEITRKGRETLNKAIKWATGNELQ